MLPPSLRQKRKVYLCFSEILMNFYQTTQCLIPQGSNFDENITAENKMTLYRSKDAAAVDTLNTDTKGKGMIKLQYMHALVYNKRYLHH
jgi:hypothetical protein